MAYVCGHFSFAGPFSRDVDLGPLQTAVNAMVQQIDSQPADDLQVFRCSHFCVVFCGLKSGHSGKMTHCVRKANYAEVARKSSLLFTLLGCIDQAPWQLVLIFVLLCLPGCHDNLSWSLFFSVCRDVMTTCPDLCSSLSAGMLWQLVLIFVLLCLQRCHDNLSWSLFFSVCRDVMTTCTDLCSSLSAGMSWQLVLIFVTYVQECHENLSWSLLCMCMDVITTCPNLCFLCLQECYDNLSWSLFFCVCREVMTTWLDLGSSVHARMSWQLASILLLLCVCRDGMPAYHFFYSLSVGMSWHPDLVFLLLS